MEKKPKYQRKQADETEIIGKYDGFIRLMFLNYVEDYTEEELIEKCKAEYSKIAPPSKELNGKLIDRLKKLKKEVERHKNSYKDFFIRVMGIMEEAQVIDKPSLHELSQFVKVNDESKSSQTNTIRSQLFKKI